jgi:hypothetical protein
MRSLIQFRRLSLLLLALSFGCAGRRPAPEHPSTERSRSAPVWREADCFSKEGLTGYFGCQMALGKSSRNAADRSRIIKRSQELATRFNRQLEDECRAYPSLDAMPFIPPEGLPKGRWRLESIDCPKGKPSGDLPGILEGLQTGGFAREERFERDTWITRLKIHGPGAEGPETPSWIESRQQVQILPNGYVLLVDEPKAKTPSSIVQCGQFAPPRDPNSFEFHRMGAKFDATEDSCTPMPEHYVFRKVED